MTYGQQLNRQYDRLQRLKRRVRRQARVTIRLRNRMTLGDARNRMDAVFNRLADAVEHIEYVERVFQREFGLRKKRKPRLKAASRQTGKSKAKRRKKKPASDLPLRHLPGCQGDPCKCPRSHAPGCDGGSDCRCFD